MPAQYIRGTTKFKWFQGMWAVCWGKFSLQSINHVYLFRIRLRQTWEQPDHHNAKNHVNQVIFQPPAWNHVRRVQSTSINQIQANSVVLNVLKIRLHMKMDVHWKQNAKPWTVPEWNAKTKELVLLRSIKSSVNVGQVSEESSVKKRFHYAILIHAWMEATVSQIRAHLDVFVHKVSQIVFYHFNCFDF